MDTQDLQASLKKSQETVRQAQRSPSMRQTPILLSSRPRLTLGKAGARSHQRAGAERLCHRGAAGPTPAANERSGRRTECRLREDGPRIEHALAADTHDVELYQVNIADNRLVAPREGRIQYRVANVGEVLAAGGKVFTMLDTGYVYIDVYLPTAGGRPA